MVDVRLLVVRVFPANMAPRHRRTHEQNQNGEPIANISEDDAEEVDFNVDEDAGLGSLEEESPGSEHAYLTSSQAQGLTLPTTTPTLTSPTLNLDAPSSMSAGFGGHGGLSMGQGQMIAANHY
jgi:hypothetical protein